MKFGIYPNLEKKNLRQPLLQLLKILKSENISYTFPVEMKPGMESLGFMNEWYEPTESMGKKDVILSVGGDGSFLGAARIFRNSPVLMAGIHLGELGFLNTITCEDMERRIHMILKHDFLEESRIYLSSFILKHENERKVLPEVLNDVVIGHDQIGRLTRLRFSLNGHFIQEYAADGLIVSSPTGSTGYSLSCGGPVLGPEDDHIIVIPICAHTLQRFPIVLKNTDTIEITAPEREGPLHISLDGAYDEDFDNTDRLVIRAVSKPIRFIRFRDQEFFSSISRKLVRKIFENQ